MQSAEIVQDLQRLKVASSTDEGGGGGGGGGGFIEFLLFRTRIKLELVLSTVYEAAK